MSLDIERNAELTGIIEDDKNVTRELAQAVSGLTKATGVLSELFPYLVAQAGVADSGITPAYIEKGTVKFQEQLTKLREQVLVLDQLENLGSSVPQEVADAFAYFDALNAGKPPFTDRYKS